MSGISEESVKKNETLVDTHGLKLLTFKTVFFLYQSLWADSNLIQQQFLLGS